jgi:hypothetical protein
MIERPCCRRAVKTWRRGKRRFRPAAPRDARSADAPGHNAARICRVEAFAVTVEQPYLYALLVFALSIVAFSAWRQRKL